MGRWSDSVTGKAMCVFMRNHSLLITAFKSRAEDSPSSYTPNLTQPTTFRMLNIPFRGGVVLLGREGGGDLLAGFP